MNSQGTKLIVLYCSCMKPESEDAIVWIGVVGVFPRSGCELLSADKGAYVNFLTLARSDSEYCAKVIGVLSHYQLELLEFENVRPFLACTRQMDRLDVQSVWVRSCLCSEWVSASLDDHASYFR